MSDLVRVLRIVEYVGERKAVEAQISRSLHGTCQIKVHDSEVGGMGFLGHIEITAATLREFPESVKAAYDGDQFKGDPK